MISIEKILRDTRKNWATIRCGRCLRWMRKEETTKVDEQRIQSKTDMPSLDIHSSAINVVDSMIFQAFSVTFVFSTILRTRCACVSMSMRVYRWRNDFAIDDFFIQSPKETSFLIIINPETDSYNSDTLRIILDV